MYIGLIIYVINLLSISKKVFTDWPDYAIDETSAASEATTSVVLATFLSMAMLC